MKCHSKRSGFSLVEMMVVIVIIGMLAAAVTVGARRYIAQSRVTTAKNDVRKIAEAVILYETTHSEYPDSLSVMYQPDETGFAALKGSGKDPWGTRYEIVLNEDDPENPFEIICFGADKREGGTGLNKDISSLDSFNEN